jgi:hypothetical protein
MFKMPVLAFVATLLPPLRSLANLPSKEKAWTT